jgi:hypothetical protein
MMQWWSSMMQQQSTIDVLTIDNDDDDVMAVDDDDDRAMAVKDVAVTAEKALVLQAMLVTLFILFA